jgi:hypothetical protein
MSDDPRKKLRPFKSSSIFFQTCVIKKKKSSNYSAGSIAQVIEHLPSKCEALSSNSIADKKKKKKIIKSFNCWSKCQIVFDILSG